MTNNKSMLSFKQAVCDSMLNLFSFRLLPLELATADFHTRFCSFICILSGTSITIMSSLTASIILCYAFLVSSFLAVTSSASLSHCLLPPFPLLPFSSATLYTFHFSLAVTRLSQIILFTFFSNHSIMPLLSDSLLLRTLHYFVQLNPGI